MALTLVIGLTLVSGSASAEAADPAEAPTPAEAPAPAKAARPAKAAPGQAARPAEAAPAVAARPTEEASAEGEGSGPAADMPADATGFAAAMEEAISKVGGRPTCDAAAGRCRYRHGSGSKAREVHLWYSAQSRTIYVFAPWMATASQDSPATPTVLRHLAALNRLLGVARFEWNPASGEVRVGSVVNVDSNLDRRALVGVLRVVEEAVDQYVPVLERLAYTPDRAPAPPRPPAEDSARSVRDAHGYVEAIERELGELGLRPTCDASRARCTYELDSAAARNVFTMVVQLDPATSTLLVYADRFVSAPSDNPRTDALLRRLLELNWEQLVPMFQWDAGSGSVRLVGAMNTDGNFDRRAFRGVVQAVHAVAERHYRAFRTILNP